MEIIDSHTHVYPDKVAEKAKEHLQKAFSRTMIDLPIVSNLFKHMDKAGISKSVVASVASRPDQVVPINNWLFSLKDTRIIPFAAMHPYFDGYKEELKRIKDNACGIKLQSEFQLFFVDDEKAFPMYEELQKLQIPVLFHCGVELSSPGEVRSSPDRILNVMKKFPELKIIGAHMGGFLMWDEVLEKLAGKNIYFDTSDSLKMKKELLTRLFEKHGFDKIFYGSDFPLEYPKNDVNSIKSLDISQENKQKILSGNIKSFLTL
ncbi:MAG: amidohydrolase family protein [Endomicrobia bacterium]|nr:amidohydrolase family protein [Endomicrobiia bacterium]MCL2506690.1 amidohydrolase family protein [Endomicrobiia bacterium]